MRVRSVVRDTTSQRNIVMAKATTNILRFLPCAKIAADMSRIVDELKDEDKVLIDDETEVIASPVILTHVDEKHNALKLFKLQDLFLNFEQIEKEERLANSFKVRFMTYRIDPEDAREIVQAMCPKCFDTQSCKDLGSNGVAKCAECDQECKLIFQM